MQGSMSELQGNVLDFIDELSPAVVDLYEAMRDYDLSGLEVLGDITQGLVSVANAAAALNGDLNLNIEDEIGAIFSQIKEIALSMENSDYLFLADILEFDVIENLEKIFNAVRDA